MARMRACTTGSLGTAKGRRSMMTQLSCFALHIDSLPEARGAEENGVRSVAELFQQGLARSGAVQQERISRARAAGGRGGRASAV